MNIYIGVLIVLIIVLFYNTFAIDRLDKKIIKETWKATPDFCKDSKLDYMILKIGDYSYLVAGDADGLLYNLPIDIQFNSSSISDDKVNFNIKIMPIDEEEKIPFPEECNLIFDRINHTISITKDDIIYGYFDKVKI